MNAGAATRLEGRHQINVVEPGTGLSYQERKDAGLPTHCEYDECITLLGRTSGYDYCSIHQSLAEQEIAAETHRERVRENVERTGVRRVVPISHHVYREPTIRRRTTEEAARQEAIDKALGLYLPEEDEPPAPRPLTQEQRTKLITAVEEARAQLAAQSARDLIPAHERCAMPGCINRRAKSTGRCGQPPKYCELPEHNSRRRYDQRNRTKGR